MKKNLGHNEFFVRCIVENEKEKEKELIMLFSIFWTTVANIFQHDEFYSCTHNESYSDDFRNKVASEMLKYDSNPFDLCISPYEFECDTTLANFQNLSNIEDNSLSFIRVLDIYEDFEHTLKSVYAKLKPKGFVMLKKNSNPILHIGFVLTYSSSYFVILQSISLSVVNDAEYGLQIRFQDAHVDLIPKVSYHFLPNCVNPETFNVSKKMISYLQKYQENEVIRGLAWGEMEEKKEVYIERTNGEISGYTCFKNDTCITKSYYKHIMNEKGNEVLKFLQPHFQQKLHVSYSILEKDFYQVYVNISESTRAHVIESLDEMITYSLNKTTLNAIKRAIPKESHMTFISLNLKRTNRLNINYINLFWNLILEKSFIKNKKDVLTFVNCQHFF